MNTDNQICKKCGLPDKAYYKGRRVCIDCMCADARQRSKTEEFRNHRKIKYHENPEKRRKTKRDSYARNPTKYIERAKTWRIKYPDKASTIDRNSRLRGCAIVLWFKLLRGGACEECGYSKNLKTLHWHHRYDKKFLISKITKNKNMFWKLANEIAKCDLLCGNCHAEKHSPNWDNRTAIKWLDSILADDTIWSHFSPNLHLSQ